MFRKALTRLYFRRPTDPWCATPSYFSKRCHWDRDTAYKAHLGQWSLYR